MTTVSIHARIDPDGKLRLEVPVGLPAGNAEVLVIVQPEQTPARAQASGATGLARSGLFTGTPAGELDVDAALNEMNDAWKSKLAERP
jgi:hypothetical protein